MEGRHRATTYLWSWGRHIYALPCMLAWPWQKQAVRHGCHPRCQVGDLPGHRTLYRSLPHAHQKEPNTCQILTGCKQWCQRAWRGKVCIAESKTRETGNRGTSTRQENGSARGGRRTGKGPEAHGGQQEGDQERTTFPGQLWVLKR